MAMHLPTCGPRTPLSHRRYLSSTTCNSTRRGPPSSPRIPSNLPCMLLPSFTMLRAAARCTARPCSSTRRWAPWQILAIPPWDRTHINRAPVLISLCSIRAQLRNSPECRDGRLALRHLNRDGSLTSTLGDRRTNVTIRHLRARSERPARQLPDCLAQHTHTGLGRPRGGRGTRGRIGWQIGSKTFFSLSLEAPLPPDISVVVFISSSTFRFHTLYTKPASALVLVCTLLGHVFHSHLWIFA